MPEQPVPNAQERALLTEAALWHQRLAADSDRQVRDEFDRWIATSPAHAAAFADTDAALQAVKDAGDEPAMLDLREQTLARLALRERRSSWRPALAASLACLFAGSAVLLGLRSLDNPAAPEPPGVKQPAALYSTGLGEVRSVELTDGSQVTLNAASRLRVVFSGKERHLALESGQAFFDVAKDASRPFVVEAAGRAVIAHGTEFDIRIDERSLRVALLEGAVSVRRGLRTSHDAVRLRPNDVLTATGDAVTVDHQGNVQALASWREGLLIFRDDELTSAVQEMNRYGGATIIIADERIAGLHISGAFRIGQTASFVDALEATFPVKATRKGDGTIVLKGR